MKPEFVVEELKSINDVKIIRPNFATDIRGTIWSSYEDWLGQKILPKKITFRHDKFSKSKKNVLRGIHGDEKTWKLVSTVYGEIYQVIIDLRRSSSTFMQWKSFVINDTNKISLLIPPGIGNGYFVQSNESIYHYKLAYEGFYNDSNQQFSYRWNDKNLGVNWPVKKPILSERDAL
jgi:dTDP-4-dehydrorhamnose 3,5-epimerase